MKFLFREILILIVVSCLENTNAMRQFLLKPSFDQTLLNFFSKSNEHLVKNSTNQLPHYRTTLYNFKNSQYYMKIYIGKFQWKVFKPIKWIKEPHLWSLTLFLIQEAVIYGSHQQVVILWDVWSIKDMIVRCQKHIEAMKLMYETYVYILHNHLFDLFRIKSPCFKLRMALEE